MMTSTQKDTIKNLRLQGLSYREVADEADLKMETVKSFYRRHGLSGFGRKLSKINGDGKYMFCRNCGERLIQKEHTKRRVFCCDACRVKWWSDHPEMIKKRAVYHFVCAHCGEPFTAYGNDGRKYCCHECYIEERFG